MALDPELTKDWLDFEQFKERYQKVPVEEYPNNVLEAIPEPVVSVRITTYQHVNYIRDAIEGVLMQKTDFPFEIIIGDDESTDGTREICIEYAEKNPDKIRLFLHKRENNIAILGKPSHIFQYSYNSFNLRGKYVVGCSGDDYWTDPLKLQKQVEFMSTNLEYSKTHHPVRTYYENSGLIKESTLSRPCTVMYKNIHARIPEQMIGVLNEDYFINFMLSTIGKSTVIDSIEPSVYRQHATGMWSSDKESNKHNHMINTVKKLIDVYQHTEHKYKLQKQLIERLVRRESKFGRSYQSKKEIVIYVIKHKLYSFFLSHLVRRTRPYQGLKRIFKNG